MENRKVKPLDDMCLMDRFLFAEYAAKKDNLELLLQIILRDDSLRLADDVQTEREFRMTPDRKQIRLDVCARDESGKIYDMEPQSHNCDSIAKRSRYYQGMLDTNLLALGEDYKNLPDSYIIFICDFDLFGKGLYVYTFKAVCNQTSFPLEDGAERIFINTKGINRTAEVSDELMELLQLFDYKQFSSSQKLQSGRVRDILGRMEKIKKDKEVGMRYLMMLDEKKEYAAEVTKELQAENEKLHTEVGNLHTEVNDLHSDVKSLYNRLTNSCILVISLCRKQDMSLEETVACLEKEMSMSHADAIDFVGQHWK